MIHFEKYQGTGNDFIMLDNGSGEYDNITVHTIQYLCHRRFGIGADGLIWVKPSEEGPFEMRYFNADGTRSFCGNGARCAVKFAKSLGLFQEMAVFHAIDGIHEAVIDGSVVRLKMKNVSEIARDGEDYVVHTGSPHYIRFVPSIDTVDIVDLGKEIRYNDSYRSEGINVNTVEICDDSIKLLTYERGVEDETLSCGTGATAAALATIFRTSKNGAFSMPVHLKGGDLEISGVYEEGLFHSLYLSGPAEKVFDGTITL
ncbi:MAG: diaminopimelate epimerase [Crocinitomicaceae bacterium]|nr:diaminopimelate epimerase [Crocinitomicaceae bacterium]